MALEKIFGQIVEIARKVTGSVRPPPPTLEGESDDDAPVPSDDEVLVTPAGEGAVLVSWQLSEHGIARARKIAADASDVAVRLFVVTRDAALGSQTSVRERTVGRAGEWLAAELPQGALVIASVGIGSGNAFVSVAHSPSTPIA